MNIPFEMMPDDSRIWIYQADRQLSEKESEFVKENTDAFLNEWAAHGAGLNASSTILYNQFLVIAVDEDVVKASGCSIDKQMHFVQAVGKELLVNFMDRSIIAFLGQKELTEKGEIFTSTMSDIKKYVADGVINTETLTFNNLIETKAQLKNKWIVSANESWLKRYFN